MEIAASIDLNTLDSLARTSRQIHAGLLQFRRMLLVSTQHCSYEGVAVDPDETFRYRARAGNWEYMEDGRNYNGVRTAAKVFFFFFFYSSRPTSGVFSFVNGGGAGLSPGTCLQLLNLPGRVATDTDS
jgi:hypothetical protein